MQAGGRAVQRCQELSARGQQRVMSGPLGGGPSAFRPRRSQSQGRQGPQGLQGLQRPQGPGKQVVTEITPVERAREFPGSPVVQTSCFYCRRYMFNPWLENKDPASNEAPPPPRKRAKE